MRAPFPRWSNTAFRLVLILIGLTIVGVPGLLLIYERTPYITSVGVPVNQPVMFDHRHHVRDDGIDCRYCHQTVETEASAGLPAVQVCMNCHNQVWPSSPLLEPIRAAYFTGGPFEWQRVHRLPDFVYFNHSIHIAKGVGCVTCHGRVDEMPQVQKDQPLTMGWCLDCHRHPEPKLRPADKIESMDWKPSIAPEVLGAQLAKQNGVRHLTYCSTCHR